MDNTVNVASVIEPLKTALVGSITPAQLVAILAGIVWVCMTIVLMWFCARMLKQFFSQAVTKGMISF